VTLTSGDWTCPICMRNPQVTIRLRCPVCNAPVDNTVSVEFYPNDSADDHDGHIDAERKFVRAHHPQPTDQGMGRFEIDLPRFFEHHIKEHEQWEFERGAKSREKEIRERIDELNQRYDLLVAQTTEPMLLKRQQECDHSGERHWLTSGEAGRMNLLCDVCLKVINAKFVGVSTPKESVGLNRVTEK
jgi:hypothetical protein